MKLFIFACVLAAALAELPRFRQARFRSQRQELAPTTTDTPVDITTESAPYPASGWKPDQPFSLPNEQPPATNYGVPYNSYGAPENSYGPPDNSYGPPVVENKEETTENPQTEKLDGPVDVQQSIGQYYILLPNGQLQMVTIAPANIGKTQNLRLRSAPLRVRNNGVARLLRF